MSEVIQLCELGSWTTKSGGTLALNFRLPFELFARPWADKNFPAHLKGIRSYTVKRLGRDARGGGEYHRFRTEIIWCDQGEVAWHLRDLLGAERREILRAGQGLVVPPKILHTYTVLADKTRMTVFCNTDFDPVNPETHDTYSADSFAEEIM